MSVSIPIGTPVNLLDGVDSGTVTGDSFALPARAVQVTVQTFFGSNPSAISMTIQVTLDFTHWTTVQTLTTTTGQVVSFGTSALGIRAVIGSITGGTVITARVICQVGVIGTGQYVVGPSSAQDGSLALYDGATGQLIKELEFPGDDTLFLNGDGAFTAAGGGSGSIGGTTTDGLIAIGDAAADTIAPSAKLLYDATHQNLGLGDALAALVAQTDQRNVAIGDLAGALITSAGQNTLVGYAAGNKLVGYGQNVAIGAYAGGDVNGDRNVFVGTAAGIGNNNFTNRCIIIGFNAGGSGALQYAIAIGDGATPTDDGHAVIGDGNVTDVYLGSESPAALLHALGAILSGLPSSDPGIPGKLYQVAGAVMVSL